MLRLAMRLSAVRPWDTIGVRRTCRGVASARVGAETCPVRWRPRRRGASVAELFPHRVAAWVESPAPGPTIEFLLGGDTTGPRESRTGAALGLRARAIAAHLQEVGAPGDRALLLYAPGIDFVEGFLGAQISGLVSVPAYPPDPTRLDRSLPRLRAMVADCAPRLVLTTRAVKELATVFAAMAPELAAIEWIATDAIPGDLADRWAPPRFEEGGLSFLQYTSGSTAAPKGVRVTHRNLQANLALMAGVVGYGDRMRMVTWLPPYHDMGLIGALLLPLSVGGSVLAFSPVDFLSRPVRWVRAISAFRANISGAPNFAFDLCARKTTDEDARDLDLSCWEIAPNGAEPVRADTMERFFARFERCGLPWGTQAPGYGLAEATLVVTGVPPGLGPRTVAFDPSALGRGRAVPASGGARLVACRRAPGGQPLLVVDPVTREVLPDGRIGELWIEGPCVADGYWDRPELSAEVFGARTADGRGPFLRTGDLGFLHEDDLYVSGRLKDVVILRGRNHYPQDIEVAVEGAHPAVRPGCVAAFSVEHGGEGLGVALEIDPRKAPDPAAVVTAVRGAVAEAHDVQPVALWLLAPGAVHKTSSGKIQRSATREAVRDGSVVALHRWEAAAPPAAPEVATPLEAPADAPPRAATETEAERVDGLRRFLVDWVARHAGIAPDAVDPDVELTRYGLDSVVSVELVDALEAVVGRPLATTLAWSHPTIRSLAHHLARPAAEPVVRLEVAPAPPAEEYPLSFAEIDLFQLVERRTEQEAYTLFVPMRVAGPVDPGALETAFRASIARQDNLRTAFVRKDGVPTRRILPDVPFAVRVEDLRGLPAGERAAALERAAHEVRHTRFDLARPPLLAARLVRVSDEESVVLVVVSHLVTDAWGLAVLHRELSAHYEAALLGEAADLPPLPLRAVDYAVATDAAYRGRLGPSAWSPWPAPDYRFPYDAPLPEDAQPDWALGPPALPTFRHTGARHGFLVDAELQERLRRAGQAHGFSVGVACLAAFQVALHAHAGTDEVLFGFVHANRRDPRLRGVVAHMVYGELYHGEIAGPPSWLDLLRRGMKFVLEDRGDEAARLFATQPLAYRVLFNYYNFDAAQPEESRFASARELARWAYLWDNHDLVMALFPSPYGVVADVLYRDQVLRPETVARLSALFLRGLEGIAADPTAPAIVER